jgi:branched-chain amino acid transport system permease protein
MTRDIAFWISIAVVLAAGLAFTQLYDNEYYFNFAYVVLQATVMAIAWNILGGFTGYVNFGSAGFFAVGAYVSVFLFKLVEAPLFLIIPVSGAVCGVIGLALGLLTLRLRGVYFAIATLAVAIVFETLVDNWDYVGGSGGAYIIGPEPPAMFNSPVEALFMVMLALAALAAAVSRYVNNSMLGRGLAAIREDEVAAECAGVPTLRLKLISTTLRGVLMGFAGAPYPFYATYLDPASAFSLFVAVNAIAMPMIGGTEMWLGPIIGALLLGSAQQIATATISSEINLLVVGVALVLFVTLAPRGIVGLVASLVESIRKKQR